MKNAKWGNLVVGLGLVLLLAAFVLLASRRAASNVPVPADPLVIATVSATVSPVITVGQSLSPAQASLVRTMSPISQNISITNTTTSISDVQNLPNNEWQTFTELEGRYSIQFPANFSFESYKSKDKAYRTNSVRFHLPNLRNNYRMVLEVEPNLDELPISAILKRLYDQTSTIPVEFDSAKDLLQTTIAGRTAYQTSILPDDSIYQMAAVPSKTLFHILLPYKDTVYHFALIYSGLLEPEPDAKMLYFQILNTFQVIERVSADERLRAQMTTHNDWSTFIDKESGYFIQYPANFFIQGGKNREESSKKIEITFQIPNQRYQGMHIQTELNSENLPIDKFLEQRIETSNDNLFDSSIIDMLEATEVAGIAAYKIRGQQASYFHLYGDTHILLPYQDKVYIFSLGYTIASAPPSSEAEIVFFQILDTFQTVYE